MTGPIRFANVLERNRAKTAAHLNPDFIAHVAAIEERNQFDDDRANARKELRELLKNETQALLRKEDTPHDH